VKKRITVLHHKYSLEDGHVTPQIRDIPGYRGVFVTTGEKQYREMSPFTSVLPLKNIKKNPKLLQLQNVAAVHIHHGSLSPKFYFLKEKYGVPLFAGFRGKDATAYPKKSQKNKENLLKLFEIGDRFFPVCRHLKKEIMALGCPEEKIRVLYGGVDLSRFNYRPREWAPGKKIRILAIGRFVEKKGFEDLIRAFAQVRKEHDNVKLELIGQGPLEAAYRRLILKLGIEDSVKLVPWVDYRAIHQKYDRSHIFCAPSVTDAEGNQEGIPNTLKEAMATGMPVVSTVHAGIPELVDNGVSGLLVPERSVTKLASALNDMVEHPDRWDAFGKQARGKIERDFNLKEQLLKQKRFYDEMIAKS